MLKDPPELQITEDLTAQVQVFAKVMAGKFTHLEERFGSGAVDRVQVLPPEGNRISPLHVAWSVSGDGSPDCDSTLGHINVRWSDYRGGYVIESNTLRPSGWTSWGYRGWNYSTGGPRDHDWRD